MAAPDGWERNEPGWYTHPVYGGICNERDGWRYYLGTGDDSGQGPYTTLREAKDAIKEAHEKLKGPQHV